jgi:hypothetical protein
VLGDQIPQSSDKDSKHFTCITYILSISWSYIMCATKRFQMYKFYFVVHFIIIQPIFIASNTLDIMIPSHKIRMHSLRNFKTLQYHGWSLPIWRPICTLSI